jgi:chromosome segregation ATPase
MKNKQTLLIIIALVIGLLIGYGIFGKKKEQKLEVKQLLSRAMQEVETIEKENKELKKKLEKEKNGGEETEKLSREKQEMKAQLEKVQQNNKQLESVIARLRAESAKTQKIKGDEKLKNQITMLEKEKQVVSEQLQKIQKNNQQLNAMIGQVKVELQQAGKITKAHEELISLSDDLKNHVTELERENQDLKAILDKIGGLTQEIEPRAIEEVQEEAEEIQKSE